MAYLITVELRASRDELAKSRVLEVAEQLEQAFRSSSIAGVDINDPRRRWNTLVVTVPQAPKLGPVMAQIQQALQDHGLDEIARIRRRRLVEPGPARPS